MKREHAPICRRNIVSTEAKTSFSGETKQTISKFLYTLVDVLQYKYDRMWIEHAFPSRHIIERP